MTVNIVKFFPAFLFCFLLLAGSPDLLSQAVSLTGDEGDASFLKDKDQWVELPELRTINSRTFRKPDGNIIVQSSAEPLCFKDKAGNIQALDLDLKYDDIGGFWQTRAQTYPACLNRDGAVTFSANEEESFTIHKKLRLNGIDLIPAEPNIYGNGSVVDFLNMQIEQLVSFAENRIKSAWVVYAIPAEQLNKSLVFSEEVIVPNGMILKEDAGNGIRLSDGSWQGDLIITTTAGEEMGRFHRPEYYDSDPQQPSLIVGSYKIVNTPGGQRVETVVPKQWVNDPARMFPLVIDPLITGPTALWGGGNMPSCSFPTYNRDSILVNIPGTITITGFFVQSSYEGAVATNTPKSDGRMYFSTTCGFSPVLTVTGPQGALPGTAYLPWSNYRAYLACCLAPSCGPQQIWVRMHLSRVNNAPGCNQNYIYYNQFSAWPFSVYAEGRTLESYGQFWTVNPATVCSNVCTLSANVYARHGVPPYTVNHPWASGPVTMGNPNPCSFNQTNIPIQLTIPGCPTYCGNNSTLVIPPPTITDACGNTAAGLNQKSVAIKPAPDVTAFPNPMAICPGDPVFIQLNSCITGTNFVWTGDNSTNGTGDILSQLFNSTPVPDTVVYTVTPTAPNGCTGMVINVPVVVNPYPGANAGPDTTIESGTTIVMNGQGGNGNATYSWSPAYNLSCTNCQFPNASPSTTTTYILEVTENGCISYDTITIFVEVAPVGLFVPNTFSPNGDGNNDVLVPGMIGIMKLDFYVFNRWGEEIYSEENVTPTSMVGWDGTYRGEMVEVDAYVWMVKAYPEDLHHPPIEMTGTVNVFGKGKRY